MSLDPTKRRSSNNEIGNMKLTGSINLMETGRRLMTGDMRTGGRRL